MWNKLLQTPLLFAYLAGGTLIAVAIGFAVPGKAVLPLLQVAVAYPVLFSLHARGERSRAVGAMLWWALLLGLITVIASVIAPEAAAMRIFNGKEYVAEMFGWIRTGIGTEGTPSLFIPQHLLHLAIFIALSIVSASLLSLVMGAVLMNYMSFYVASLILSSKDLATAVIMGWHPWSIFRVAAFVVLGVILGEPLICKIAGRQYKFEGAAKYLWISAAGILCDIILKTMLAPWWGMTLRNILQ